MIARRGLILAGLGAAALTPALAAPKPKAKPASPGPDAADMAIGSAKAPVTLIEYASLACGHCRIFNMTVLEPLKAKYLASGKVRFVFREFRTPPEVMATAGYQLARCKGADAKTYHERIAVLFAEQPAIFEAGRAGKFLDKYNEIAARFKVTPEEFQACLNDPAADARMTAVEQGGVTRFGVNSTPTVILNGKVVPLEDHTLAGMTARIEALLKKR
ncbi:MAG: thioredoxin domain-containing protein [Caulobacterales bacterium]|jgi:protein-disulfide isomerase